MASYAIEADRSDGRRFRLGELGSFRIDGFGGRRSTVDVDGRSLQVSNEGRFPRRAVFTENGRTVGSFVPHGMVRSGATLDSTGSAATGRSRPACSTS